MKIIGQEFQSKLQPVKITVERISKSMPSNWIMRRRRCFCCAWPVRKRQRIAIIFSKQGNRVICDECIEKLRVNTVAVYDSSCEAGPAKTENIITTEGGTKP